MSAVRKLLVIAGGLVLACGTEADPAAALPPARPGPVPTVEFAGCADVKPGVCTLDPHAEKLDLWVEAEPGGAISVELDGASVDSDQRPVDGGIAIGVKLPAGAAHLRLQGTPPWTAPWELSLRWFPPIPALERNRELRLSGQGEKAAAGLAEALLTAVGVPRLRMLDTLRRGPPRPDPQLRLRLTLETAELARLLGFARFEADAWAFAASVAEEAGQVAAAEAYVAAVRRHEALLPEARLWAAFQAAKLARAQGDVTGDLEQLVAAQTVVRRLSPKWAVPTALSRATALAELGRGEEVAAEITIVLDALESISCGSQGRALNTIGWINLLLAQQGLRHTPPQPWFEAALERVGSSGACPLARVAVDVHVDLALAAVAEYEPYEALDHLGDAEPLPQALEAWGVEVRARAGVQLRRWDLVPSLLRKPAEDASPSLQWAGWMRQAQALEGFGLADAAVDAALSAEAVLDRSLAAVGIALGGELFLAGRSASAQRLVRLLLERDEVEAAFCRARLARGRALRRLDRAARLRRATPELRERWSQATAAFLQTRARLARSRAQDWELSAADRALAESRRDRDLSAALRILDAAFRAVGSRAAAPTCADLPPIADDESVVMVFPLVGDAVLFAANSTRVEVRRVEDASDPVAVAAGLEALRGVLTDRIRVLTTGSSGGLRFHELTVGGEPLISSATLTYALDLDPTLSSPRDKRAVVVADPSDNLPHALSEAGAVAAALEKEGFDVARHEGEQATRAAVIAALAAASRLHYAGHGVHGGLAGWGAALLLPDRDTLSVADILALPGVPSDVVLAGCDTGHTTDATLGGGMNLGRAFLLAGSSTVVVADRPIDDALARRVAEGLYEHGADSDLPRALARVQNSLRAADPKAQWAAFRVVVR